MKRQNGAEGEIRTPEVCTSGFRDHRHTGLGYLRNIHPHQLIIKKCYLSSSVYGGHNQPFNQ